MLNLFKRSLSAIHLFNSDKLTNKLSELKGPLMKAAQFLATIPGAIPNRYSEKFLSLQQNAKFYNIDSLNLPINFLDNFDHFEKTPIGAASIGQVHKAIYKGKNVACKIQYNGISNIIDEDLKLIKFILNTIYTFSPVIDHSRVFEELFEHLRKECDYNNELLNIENFSNCLNILTSTIPKTYKDVSNSKIIVMDFLDGKSVLDNGYDSYQRNIIAKNLFKSWYYPFYNFGLLHADPHPGNYNVNDDLKINLFDFGCVRKFEKTSVLGVKTLYEGLKHNNLNLQKDAYAMLGFKNLGFKNFEIIDVLNEWAKLLLGPVLNDRVLPIQPNFNANHGFETAKKVYKKLKECGGVCPPREFVFLDRVAVCLGGVFMRMKVELNWHEMFEDIINKQD